MDLIRVNESFELPSGFKFEKNEMLYGTWHYVSNIDKTYLPLVVVVKEKAWLLPKEYFSLVFMKIFYTRLKELGFVRTMATVGYSEYYLEKYKMKFYSGSSNGDTYYNYTINDLKRVNHTLGLGSTAENSDKVYEEILATIESDIKIEQLTQGHHE